jgi:uncharacterized protein YbjT (DUF2867 family)
MILVTGGTGFVGQEVVVELLRLGYRVRLLVRDPARAGRFAHDPRVQLAQGDLLKPETLSPAMEGLHAVIHLVGIISETSRMTYEQAHVEATRNLLSAAKKAGVTRMPPRVITSPNGRPRNWCAKAGSTGPSFALRSSTAMTSAIAC